MNRLKQITLVVLKILLGLALVVFAVLTIFGMDCFELYVYSYHVFSLTTSFLVARIVVIIELVIGVLLIGSLLFSNRIKKWSKFNRRIAIGCLVVIPSITVFAITPPDNFTSAYNSEQNLQVVLFDNLLNGPPLDSLNLLDGYQVLGFFSTGCETCQLAAQKLSLMQRFYSFPPENITCVFMGNKEDVQRFFAEAQSPNYRSVLYDDVVKMVKAIGGQFPTVVFMKDGTVVYSCGYRDMKESEIKAFFTQP